MPVHRQTAVLCFEYQLAWRNDQLIQMWLEYCEMYVQYEFAVHRVGNERVEQFVQGMDRLFSKNFLCFVSLDFICNLVLIRSSLKRMPYAPWD